MPTRECYSAPRQQLRQGKLDDLRCTRTMTQARVPARQVRVRLSLDWQLVPAIYRAPNWNVSHRELLADDIWCPRQMGIEKGKFFLGLNSRRFNDRRVSLRRRGTDELQESRADARV